jgi:hypothetical protein
MCAFVNAQTADEIIQKHIEKTGGIKAWEAVKSIKMIATMNMQGQSMTLEDIKTKEGYLYSATKMRGMKIVQMAFDGKTVWGANTQTMKSEKINDKKALEDVKREAKNFPSPYINYKAKGFTIELSGEQSIEGIDCYKLKLTTSKKGAENNNTRTVFISKKSYFEIALEEEINEGQMKGVMRIVFSDFKEVNGITLPYTITQSMQNQKFPLIIESYEINGEIDKTIFEFKQ